VGSTNSGYQVVVAIRFCRTAPNICGSWAIASCRPSSAQNFEVFPRSLANLCTLIYSVNTEHFEFLYCVAFSARKSGQLRCPYWYLRVWRMKLTLCWPCRALWLLYVARFNIHKCYILHTQCINPLNAELNPICHLLALLEAHYILYVSRIRVKEETSEVLLLGRSFAWCWILDALECRSGITEGFEVWCLRRMEKNEEVF
jgi:hypothetical protein